MNIFESFKAITAVRFPLISNEELVKLGKNINEQYIRRQRMSKVSGTLSLNDSAERDLLKAYDTIYAALIKAWNLPQHAFQNIHALLADIVLSDESAQKILVNEWANYLLEALKYETYPLKAVKELLENDSTAIQRAAFLLFFLRRGISADEILHSELLHHFFESSCDRMEEVTDIYRILALGIQENEPNVLEIKKLLTQVSSIKVKRRDSGLEEYTLNGLRSPNGTISNSTIQIAFALTPHPDNLCNLYHIFGTEFLIQMLSHGVMNRHQANKRFIVNLLKNMSLNDVKDIYHTILYRTVESKRLEVLRGLGEVLPHAQQLELINANKVSPIILCAVNPLLVHHISTEQFTPYLHSPLKFNEAPYALLLLGQQAFSFLHESLSEQLLDLILKQNLNTHTNLFDDNEGAFAILGEQEIFRRKCAQEIEKNLQELKACIANNTSFFTQNSYHNICRLHDIQSPKVSFLKRFTQIKSDYPRNIYGVQALIIEALFETQKLNLSNCLEIIHFYMKNSGSYSNEEVQTAEYQTIYGCLSFTRNIELQNELILFLENNGQQDWMWSEISGVQFIEQVLLNNNQSLLEKYFPPEMTAEDRLKQLEKISLKIVKNPQFNNNEFSRGWPAVNSSNASSLNPPVRQINSFPFPGLATGGARLSLPRACIAETSNTQTPHLELIAFMLDNASVDATKSVLNLYSTPFLKMLMQQSVKQGSNKMPFIHYIAAKNIPILISILDQLSNERKELLSLKNMNNSLIVTLFSGFYDDINDKLRILDAKAVESIMKFLAMYSIDEVKDLLKRCNLLGDKNSLLAQAADHPLLFQKLIELYEGNVFNDLIKNVRLSLLFHTLKTPRSFSLILDTLTLPQVEEAVFHTSETYAGSAIFAHSSVKEPQILGIMMQRLSQTKPAVQIIQTKNSNNQNLIHCAAPYVSSLNILFKGANGEILPLLNECDKEGNQPLYYARESVEAMEAILAIYPDDTARFNAIAHKNKKGQTLLHDAHPDVVKVVLQYYPENERLQAILGALPKQSKLKSGWLESIMTVLKYDERYIFITQVSAEDLVKNFTLLLSFLDGAQIFRLLQIETIYKELVDNCNLESILRSIFYMLAPNDQFSLAKKISINFSNIWSLSIVLKAFGDRVLSLLCMQDEEGNQPLYYARGFINAVKEILSFYPNATSRWNAIQHKNNEGRTLLYGASFEVIQTILSEYPEEERFVVLQEQEVIEALLGTNQVDSLIFLMGAFTLKDKFIAAELIIQKKIQDSVFIFSQLTKVLRLLKSSEIIQLLEKDSIFKELKAQPSSSDRFREISFLLDSEDLSKFATILKQEMPPSNFQVSPNSAFSKSRKRIKREETIALQSDEEDSSSKRACLGV